MSERISEMRCVRDRLILAALPLVPFDGWSAKALGEAARDAGFDPTMGERAFPGGPVEAVVHFAAMADARLAEDAQAAGLELMKVGERIAWLVRRRLEPWAEHREAIRRAVTLLSLPSHAPAALNATWHTVDTLWYAAGDVSADFSFYTKRATLAAIYTATLLYWLDDRSEGAGDSWAFLRRRLDDAMALPRLRKTLTRKLDHLPNPLACLPWRSGGRTRFGVHR